VTDVAKARELAGAEILVIDVDPAVQRGLDKLLAAHGLAVTSAATREKAFELLAEKFFGVVLVDLDTPEPGGGIALVGDVRERSPTSIVIVLSTRKSFDSSVAAFRAGANDVILKAPDQVEYLTARIVDAAGDSVTRRGTSALFIEVREALEEFLKGFMESDRRLTDLEDQVAGRPTERADADAQVQILFVDGDDRLFQSLSRKGKGYGYTLAQTGGEALDYVTKTAYQIALVGPTLPDLPSSLVIKTLKAHAPETTVIAYEPNGRLEIVEGARSIPIVERFTAAVQLAERMDELAEAHRAKLRERRYLAAFRERHYDFLRRLSDLRKKIERAIEDGKDTFKFQAGG
jgi:DNA-binding NtrC family response regulator